MLAADRRRAFGFWLPLAMLLCFGLCMADISFYVQDRADNALLVFQFCGAVTPVFSILPVIAALPFATGFGNDWRSGMAVSMTLRCGSRRFLRSKLLSCALSGGLALAGGMLLFVLFINGWFQQDYASVAQMLADMPFCDVLDGGAAGTIQFYGVFVLLQFLSGAFWATAALAISAFMPSPSLTLCAPLRTLSAATVSANPTSLPSKASVTGFFAFTKTSPAVTAAAKDDTFGSLISTAACSPSVSALSPTRRTAVAPSSQVILSPARSAVSCSAG